MFKKENMNLLNELLDLRKLIVDMRINEKKSTHSQH